MKPRKGEWGERSVTQEEFIAAIHDTVYLAGCAVKEEIPDQHRVLSMNLDAVYQVSNGHALAAAVGMALETAGVRTNAFTQAIAKSKRKAALMNADRHSILEKLEQAGIWYMPLKGSVLQADYPQIGMRQMSDNDILFDPDRFADVKKIMKSLGYSVINFGVGHHDVYNKQPVSHFEMHRQLFSSASGEAINKYFRQAMNRLLPDQETRYGRHFSANDFYLYMIAHAYKHYSVCGTGLRSLLDVYVYVRKHGDALNWALIGREAKKLGLSSFEHQNRNLALHLFDGLQLTEQEKEMFLYMASSGTYGTIQHRVNNNVEKLGGGVKGKAKYFMHRMILPMHAIQAYYPFVYQHKILLPFFIVFRLIHAVGCRRAIVLEEIRAIRHSR